MKNPLFIALATVIPCLAADPVYTPPSGYVKLGNTSAGQDAVPANTDVNLALPLEKEVAFTGQVASSTATQVTVQGTPDWTTDAWVPSSGAPYCAVITSGTENGIRGLITANNINTLTLTLTTPGDLTNLTAGDSVVIRNCWTLSTIFADATLTDNCQVLVFDETEDGINHASSANYLYSAGSWFNATDFSNADDIVIHPGERFILRSNATPIPSLTLFGEVPDSAFRLDLTKDGTGEEDIEISHSNPTPTIIGDLAIPAEDNDQLLTFDNTSTGINKSSAVNLLYFGGAWFDASDFSDVTSTFALPPGQGFVLRRSVTSSGSPVEWIEPAPYSP